MKFLSFVYFLAILPGICHAASSEVSYDFYFSSSVTTNTCLIYINDELSSSGVSTSTSNVNISLPVVNSVLLNSVGDVAGLTGMAIKVKYCPTSQQKATLSLNSEQVNSQTGNLANSFSGVGGAKNIEIQLLTNDKKPIIFNGQSENFSLSLSSDKIGNDSYRSGGIDFYLQYISLGNIKPGKVVSTLMYTISYD